MTTINTQAEGEVGLNQWVQIGLVTAVVSVFAVLIVQVLAVAIWPDIALFKPLDSYGRTALFTLVPAIGATAVFAWLAGRKRQPVQTFIKISAVVLLLSIIPDYILPVPDKTFLASTVTAFMHVVAGVVTVTLLVKGYNRLAGRS
jgi:hypothetical protein